MCHVSKLVDVEAVKAGGQTLDLASDLHLASRAPSLNNNIVTHIMMFVMFVMFT